MHRFRLLVITLCTLIVLASCGKTEAAQNVDDRIANLQSQKVTIHSGIQISKVEDAVNELTQREKMTLSNLGVLKSIRSEYEEIANEAISDTEKAIESIGDITLENESSILAAKTSYSKLSDELKSRVSNADKLQSALNQLGELKIQELQSLIDSIGTVTIESEDTIEAANQIYIALTPEEKAKVKNAQLLTDAIEKLQELKASEKEKRIATLKTKMTANHDDFQKCTFYEPSRMPKYIDVRSFILPYIGQNDNSGYKWLVLRYNYAGKSWVFFSKVIILVDGQTYTKEFDYFDVTRNSGYGSVGEQYDDLNVSTFDKDMLQKIANSTETKIRFEGSDYREDITVSDKDKAAIQDVLDLYELL